MAGVPKQDALGSAIWCRTNSPNDLRAGMRLAFRAAAGNPLPTEAFMRTSIAAGSLLTALLLAGPANAQQVQADIVLRTGPVASRVFIGNGYSTYGRQPVVYRRVPVRRVVVAPRVIVVERVRHHRYGHWSRFGYRPVTLYYIDGRYFDRSLDRPGLRPVVVYERGGRYYRESRMDDRYDGDRYDRDHDRQHDRHDWDD